MNYPKLSKAQAVKITIPPQTSDNGARSPLVSLFLGLNNVHINVQTANLLIASLYIIYMYGFFVLQLYINVKCRLCIHMRTHIYVHIAAIEIRKCVVLCAVLVMVHAVGLLYFFHRFIGTAINHRE